MLHPAELRHRAIWSAQESVPFLQRLPVIKEWISECCEQHPSCSSSSTDFLPTRLLDVGQGHGSKLRLVESKDIIKIPDNCPKFVALSHSWGKVRPSLVLDSSSIDIISSSLELAELPRTFKDAARIT